MGFFRKTKCNASIIGVYPVKKHPEVKVIEMTLDCPPSQVDISKFIHPIDNFPKSSWQVPYDEKYLNENGTESIGGFCDVPADIPYTRLVFFLHFVNLAKPLLSPFGRLKFPEESPMPNRLRSIIKYVPVD